MNVANFRHGQRVIQMTDKGGMPYVEDINSAVLRNGNFRSALWTGSNLQMTMMSVQANGEVGLEVHRDVDQFLYILSGNVFVMMGNSRNNLTFRQSASGGYGIFVPAGVWHNIVNAGNSTVKLFTVYAPPEHPRGTVEVYPPSQPVPQTPTYPSRPARPPSSSYPSYPQVPTYPANPVRPPSSSYPSYPQVPTYPANPVRPPISSLPAAPLYPAMPVEPMPFSQEVSLIDEALSTEI